jgi:hypothetical protein
MIPLLTYPLALLGLAALPALAAIYVLRNRYRRQPVSSLLLWRHQAVVREGGFKVDRLQLPLIFFLELMALLLLVVAATGPRWQLPSTIRPLIVIVDNSQSMQAGPPLDTPRRRAENALHALLTKQRFRSLRVILAGLEARSVAAPVEVNASPAELLKDWTCTEPKAELEVALVMAVELARQEADILVLTDHAPPLQSLPEKKVRWWSFGRPLPNLAIVNARRTAHVDLDRCLIELANYSSTAQSVNFSVKSGATVLRESTLTLEPGGNERVVFNVPAATPLLEAALPEDALTIDNRAQLLPPQRRKVRVQTALTNEPLKSLVQRALEATSLCVAVNDNPELILHERTPAVSVLNAWDLRILTGDKATPFTGPFLLDPSHPLAQGIDLPGVIWAAPTTNPLPGMPVISAGNVALLTAQEDALGRQHLTLQIAPEFSTLPASPNWPALFWNLLNWRLSECPGLRDSNFRLGADVEFSTPESKLRLESPMDRPRDLTVRSRPFVVRPEHCGLHVLSTERSTNIFVVNFLAPQESDLRSCVTGRWGEWQNDPEIRFEYESVLWIFLLLSLVALNLHLVALARSKARI